MDHFQYQNGELYAAAVPIREIAEVVDTPFYCYSSETLEHHYKVFADAMHGLDAHIFYAVKANSNISVIATLARLGAGADVVSSGEMKRALVSGVPAAKIVFSGVGKTQEEMAQALNAGVLQINVESLDELEMLSDVASSLGIDANVAIRVNPDVDALTHKKITTGKSENKFGIDWAQAPEAFVMASKLPRVNAKGIAVHIGSQILDLKPFRQAFELVVDLVKTLRTDGHAIENLDLGGGLGIPYGDETPPSPKEYGEMVKSVIRDFECRVFFEPGRLIAGNAGLLVTRVIRVKQGLSRSFIIVDAAMNDLLRPALYDAQHKLQPVIQPSVSAKLHMVEVVGPICETGDTFGQPRSMPVSVAGSLLVIRTAGAYGAVMASNYNTRPLIPEVMVKGDNFSVIRNRVTVDDMLARESLPAWLID
jgi:diaminopimelate decarboxylase